MSATQTHEHWFVTADSRRAILFRGSKDEHDRLRLAEDRSVLNVHENDHEHQRPSALGRVASSGAAPSFASFGHGDEECQRRFARDVCAWLRKAHEQLQFPTVTVFAPPEFIGHLRTELNGLSSKVELRRAELTKLPKGELATHPAILEEVQRQEVRRRKR